MAIQTSVAVRNAQLDAVETTAGTSAVLRIRSGAQPSSCAAARTGTVLATLQLPSDWMANAAAGSKALAGVWQDPSADAAGTPGHYEIMDSTLTTCHLQGSVTLTGGGGDLQVESTDFQVSKVIDITAFNLTMAGA